MYVFTKYEGNEKIFDYARAEKERQDFLWSYAGWNYQNGLPAAKIDNYKETKIPRFRLRNIIKAAHFMPEVYSMPETPRKRRKLNRIVCPF